MRVGRIRGSLPALAGLVLSACGSTTLVLPRLSATYVLERVNGRPTPAVSAQGDGYRVTVLADTLVFAADGTVERRNTVRYVGVLSINPDTTIHNSMKWAYTIDGTKLTIGVISCPANASCVGPSTGYIDADRLELTDAGMADAVLHFAPR